MEANFDRFTRRQLGLVTLLQLLGLGWSRSAIRHSAGTGVLVPVRPGVWRVVGAAVTREQAWLAA
ncbi:MAG TPA: hypothetical protein VFO65_13980, partial [Acidimicrobiales bacterium]|nr:hypothetical protein [Acidimicrobiales bacterium]